MRNHVVWVLALIALPALCAERRFDFSDVPENKTPPGFRSAVSGQGKPGEWRVILDEVPPQLAPLSPQAPSVSKRPVLAQVAQDPTDEHFPLLIFEDETFDDFTFTMRFKTVKGVMEQMAGVAFRIQNETNYYVLRASSLGNTFRFYKVVNGQRSTPVGTDIAIPSGSWHELTVECKGNQIRCLLDGKQLIPMLTDTSFARGKIGFWTKSDSVSYFADAKVVYTPQEPPLQGAVVETLKVYPRLLGLEVYVLDSETKRPKLVGSKEAKKIGQEGGHAEEDVIKRGVIYYGKEKGSVVVTMPVHDRNGEAVAAARVILSTFPGQTEQTALARALPIVREIEGRMSKIQLMAE